MIVNSENEKLKVIYCMGSGRSGSTLLGIILGSHPKLFSPGEINSYHRINEDKFTCSCLKKVADCEFWSEVYEKWRISIGEQAAEQTMAKSKVMENFKSPWAWLKIILESSRKSKRFQEYLDYTYKFLETAAVHNGKSVIVDISKNPLRAFILMQHPTIDLRLIHLVRDGRGVAWSLNKFTKPGVKQKPIWRTALFWGIVNWQSNYVRRKAKNSGLIRYEDLVKSPETTLAQIGKIADIDSKPLIEALNADLAPNVTHIMAGNKLRREKSIKLKLDTEWQEKMSTKKEKLFMRLAGKLLSSYGYGGRNHTNS